MNSNVEVVVSVVRWTDQPGIFKGAFVVVNNGKTDRACRVPVLTSRLKVDGCKCGYENTLVISLRGRLPRAEERDPRTPLVGVDPSEGREPNSGIGRLRRGAYHQTRKPHVANPGQRTADTGTSLRHGNHPEHRRGGRQTP